MQYISFLVKNCKTLGTAEGYNHELIAKLCGLLSFKQGGHDGFHDHHLISTQFQALGCPDGELGTLNVNDFTWNTTVHCLMGDWS